MAWPDTTALSRTNLDADADTVTGTNPDGGREQINKAVQRLNSLLNASTQGSVLYTTNNPQPYQPISGVSQNEIVIGSVTGTPAGSNKTLETTLTDSDTKVSTSKAVKTYVDAEVAGASSFQASCLAIAGGTFESGNNILSAANTVGSATWVITFSTHFANTSYVVLLTTEDTNGSGTNVEYASVESKTTNVLTVRASAGSTVTGSGITALNVAVIGTLA